jgi:hypothetical protein
MMSDAGWVVVGDETQWCNSFIVRRREPYPDLIQVALLELWGFSAPRKSCVRLRFIFVV